jgi:hypothetical protein
VVIWERVPWSRLRLQSPMPPKKSTNININRRHPSIPMAKFKTEPGHTPRPSRKLPALGHHATFRPGTTHVQKQKQKQKRKIRPQHQPSRSIDSLTPKEQVVKLKQSRKAIKSKLYGRIAHLQVCPIVMTHHQVEVTRLIHKQSASTMPYRKNTTPIRPETKSIMSTFHVPFASGPASSWLRRENFSPTASPNWALTTPHARHA